MKFTLDIKETKTFEIDSDLYQFVKDLEPQEALDKVLELLAEQDDDKYDADGWLETEKLDLLDRKSTSIKWTTEIKPLKFEQRYRVYNYDTHQTLFKGNYGECATYISEREWDGASVDINEA